MLGRLFSTDDDVHTWRPLALLVAMVLKIVLFPFEREFPFLNLALSLIVLFGAIAVAAYNRRAMVVGTCLGIGSALLFVLHSVNGSSAVYAAGVGSAFLLYIFALSLMMRRFFRARRGTPPVIALAITCYLLIPHVWAGFFEALEKFQPGSFSRLSTSTTPVEHDLYYFSFVTMTTLGYGDITPISPLARSMAILEVLCGVFFLGIFIARLIGTYEPEADAD
jgi:hypothetical protein